MHTGADCNIAKAVRSSAVRTSWKGDVEFWAVGSAAVQRYKKAYQNTVAKNYAFPKRDRHVEQFAPASGSHIDRISDKNDRNANLISCFVVPLLHFAPSPCLGPKFGKCHVGMSLSLPNTLSAVGSCIPYV